MQRAVVTILIVAALLGVNQVVQQRGSGGDRDYPSHGCDGAEEVPRLDARAEAEEATLCLLNAERRRHGREPFRASERLQLAAAAHAEDMVERRYFEHDSPEGVSPHERIARAGYTNPVTGENLGYGQGSEGSPASIVDGWMHSPGHRRNILRKRFTQIGVSVVPAPVEGGGDGGTYVTTFGGPG